MDKSNLVSSTKCKLHMQIVCGDGQNSRNYKFNTSSLEIFATTHWTFHFVNSVAKCARSNVIFCHMHAFPMNTGFTVHGIHK